MQLTCTDSICPLMAWNSLHVPVVCFFSFLFSPFLFFSLLSFIATSKRHQGMTTYTYVSMRKRNGQSHWPLITFLATQEHSTLPSKKWAHLYATGERGEWREEAQSLGVENSVPWYQSPGSQPHILMPPAALKQYSWGAEHGFEHQVQPRAHTLIFSSADPGGTGISTKRRLHTF